MTLFKVTSSDHSARTCGSAAIGREASRPLRTGEDGPGGRQRLNRGLMSSFWEGTQVPGTGTCQVVYANVTYGGVRDHRGDPQDSDDLPWLQTGTQLHLECGSPPSPRQNPPVMLMVWLLILSLLGQLSVCSTMCEVQGLQEEDHLPNTGKTIIIIVLVLGISTGTATKHHTNDSDFYFYFFKRQAFTI